MADEFRPLRILLTNNSLGLRAGSELYLRDLAVALMKRGHSPIAYSPVLGAVAEELRAMTIPTIDDLDDMETPPDLIHGQHHHETMTAVLRYPMTPAIFICHGWAPWEEIPPTSPNILRYVAVDDLCRERLFTTPGILQNSVITLYNFVDLGRFNRWRKLNAKPKSALVFSNYARDVSPEIRTACAKAGIERVDIVGEGSGNRVARPENILADYDIVFAKARAAIEAIASGCAVIVTDYAGLGGMVTTRNLQHMRGLNFGVRTMQATRITEENVARELTFYDADDVQGVSVWMRKDADMSKAIDNWLSIYRDVLREWGTEVPRISDAARLRAGSRYLRFLAGPLKSRGENERMRHRAEKERDHLSERLAERETQLAGLSAGLADREAELAALRGSFGQRLVLRFRKAMPWL